eukprot:3328370-Amphidinium_carterae.1
MSVNSTVKKICECLTPPGAESSCRLCKNDPLLKLVPPLHGEEVQGWGHVDSRRRSIQNRNSWMEWAQAPVLH